MLKVIDISQWEDSPSDPRKVDFVAMRAAGVTAAYFRAGNGLGEDTAFEQFRRDANAADVPWGAYGIMYPGYSMASQARELVTILVNDSGQLPIAIDWEVVGVTWNHIYEYIAVIQEVLPTKEIIIYTTADILKTRLANIANIPQIKWFQQFQIWQAHYANAPADLPTGFTRVLWQFTDRADASLYGITEAKMVDMSYYNGTETDFQARFKLAVLQPHDDPAVTPTPGVVPQVVSPVYMRVREDVETPGTRPYIRVGLPETVVINGGKGNVNLPDAWYQYWHKLNPDLKVQAYLEKDASGWHNTGAVNNVRQITFAGNIVQVNRVDNGRAYIAHYNCNDAPPAAVRPTVTSLSPLVQWFTAGYRDHTDMSVDGRYPLIFVIANGAGEDLWMDARDLAPYTVANVTVKVTNVLGINMRLSPYQTAKWAGYKSFGVSVKICGITTDNQGNLWGRLDLNTWFCLRFGNTWFTDFRG